VQSKRLLRQLVEEKHVSGWDDPRMPTLAGLRRRGVTPEAIKAFCERTGVSTRNSTVEVSLFEHAVREHLNATSKRVMAVLKPLKVTLENFAEGEVIWFDAPYDPEKPDGPSRKVPFTRELFIERDDFMEVAAKKWFRLAPGAEVRLRYAALVTCKEVKKDAQGNVTELICTWDPQSKGGAPHDGRKVKGTVHWVSATHAKDAEVRLYDRLFSVENPTAGDEKDAFLKFLNPGSLEIVKGVKVEPSLASAKPLDRIQFERIGYFCVDQDTKDGALVFNRTITLKDSWTAQAAK
jgi:glutaminyl-tRNA synthetase